MHKIFVTDGIVLGKRGVGEATSQVMLLAREHGLIFVSARSARFERSKLRFGLEPLTLARFSLVRGRYGWKLTGVEQISMLDKGVSLERRRSLGKVSRLLLRLLSGEDPSNELFETVREGFGSLVSVSDESVVEYVEYVLVLRVLARLGYVAEGAEIAPFMSMNFHAEEFPTKVRAHKSLLIRTINESLGVTGL